MQNNLKAYLIASAMLAACAIGGSAVELNGSYASAATVSASGIPPRDTQEVCFETCQDWYDEEAAHCVDWMLTMQTAGASGYFSCIDDAARNRQQCRNRC